MPKNIFTETDEHRGEKRERQTIEQTLNYTEQTWGCWRGSGVVGWFK